VCANNNNTHTTIIATKKKRGGCHHHLPRVLLTTKRHELGGHHHPPWALLTTKKNMGKGWVLLLFTFFIILIFGGTWHNRNNSCNSRGERQSTHKRGAME
jgi:hypothetical protein